MHYMMVFNKVRMLQTVQCVDCFGYGHNGDCQTTISLTKFTSSRPVLRGFIQRAREACKVATVENPTTIGSGINPVAMVQRSNFVGGFEKS